MSKPFGLLALLVLLLVSAASATAQTHKEFGTWEYVGLDDYEGAHTESTDPNRTFSLEVECGRQGEGELNVALSFLLASSADAIGFDSDRFNPDGEVEARLDGEKLEGNGLSFSTYSEVFEHQQPEVFLAALKEADGMSIEVWDTYGEHVGTYSFDLRGVASLLDFLSCYPGTRVGRTTAHPVPLGLEPGPPGG